MRKPVTPRPTVPPPGLPHFNLGGSLLLAGLVTALVAILSELVARFVPGWRPGYLAAACLLIAVEAALVHYRMRQGQHLDLGALRYLAAELFALAVLMRVVATLSLGVTSLEPSLRLWLRSPLAALDAPFMACLAAGLAAALAVRGGLRALAELEPRRSLDPDQQSLEAEFYHSSADAGQRQALARISTTVAWGGIAALVGLVAMVVDLAVVTAPPRLTTPLSATAGMAYLICGVLLFSRARLGLLNARWHREGAEVEAGVLPGWRRAGAAVALIVALGALFLPRSYGLGLLDAGRSGALAIANLLALIALVLGVISLGAFSLLITIPLLLLFLIASLGGLSGAPVVPALPPPLPPPTPTITSTPPLAPSLIFWACIAILAGSALWAVARRQGWVRLALERARAGWAGQLWARLCDAWLGWRGYARSVASALAERLRPPPPPPAPRRPPSLRLHRLAPRELIRYFYASTLQRAARRGIGRPRAATPYEYGAELRSELPEAADDIAGLTDAYVRAAYAPAAPSPADAHSARGPWQRLRRKLQAKK